MAARKRGLGPVPLVLAVLITLSAAAAQAAIQKPVVGHVSFGASLPQGSAGDFLDDGWSLHGGATWFAPDRPMGLRLDLGLDWWDAKSSFLSQLDTDTITPGTQAPDDGDAQVWSGTVNFLWEPETKGVVGFYLTGGLGLYYTSWDISEIGYGTGYWCDWWTGWCYPTLVQGEYTIADASNWEWGYNAGLGVTFHLQSGAEIYLEAVYHWIQSDNSAEFMPVSVGFRW